MKPEDTIGGRNCAYGEARHQRVDLNLFKFMTEAISSVTEKAVHTSDVYLLIYSVFFENALLFSVSFNLKRFIIQSILYSLTFFNTTCYLYSIRQERVLIQSKNFKANNGKEKTKHNRLANTFSSFFRNKQELGN